MASHRDPSVDARRLNGPAKGRLITRHKLITRLAHWTWTICLFFLLLSGLQIFNAHPTLYIGEESGFAYDNAVLSIRAEESADGPTGITTILGHMFDTTGVLGVSGSGEGISATAFPSWLTIPSRRDLATGRVVHLFFAWVFLVAILVWFFSSLANRHLAKDLLPRARDIRGLGGDMLDHVRFRFSHSVRYTPLQKLAYGGVLFVLFPLIVLTGLCMSPGVNALLPWLTDIFGGRQTARTLHFITMALLVLFFVVHILMVLAAGPINEIRSMITGRYSLSQNTSSGIRYDQ